MYRWEAGNVLITFDSIELSAVFNHQPSTTFNLIKLLVLIESLDGVSQRKTINSMKSFDDAVTIEMLHTSALSLKTEEFLWQ